MRYVALIREATSTLEGDFSLAQLLARVDALDRSVPTLAELNDALSSLRSAGGRVIPYWHPVSPEAYAQALVSNREAVAQFCEAQGISREQQETIQKWHASIWSKHGA